MASRLLASASAGIAGVLFGLEVGAGRPLTWTHVGLVGIGLLAILAAASSARPAAGGMLGRRSEESLADAVNREIDRSRRYRHSLALLRLTSAVGSNLPQLRATDRVFAAEEATFLVLPETDRAGAVRALSRIAPAGDMRMDATTFVFPADALTSRALLRAVQSGAAKTGRGEAGPEPATSRLKAAVSQPSDPLRSESAR